MRRLESAAALLLTLLVVVLHAVRAAHSGALWRDEAGGAQLARQATVGAVVDTFHRDSFPLLFPLALRSFTAVCGDSDRALRGFGLAIGLAIVGALWLNARAAGTVPLVSLTLLGFHPSFLIFGDSLRGYGLGILLILLAFGAFTRLVAQADRGSVLNAALLALLSVHCLWQNAALLLGVGTAAAIVGAVRGRWRLTAAALGIGLLAALSLVPYLGRVAAARDFNIVVTQKLGMQEIAAGAVADVGLPIAGGRWAWAALLVTAAVVTVWALARNRREDRPQVDAQLFRLLAIAGALGGQLVFFLILGFLPRIWYVLALMALVASALDGLLAGAARGIALRRAGVAVPVLLAGLALPAIARQAMVRMTNVDRVAQAVAAGAGGSDLVLVNYWFYGVSFQRYYRGAAPWMTLPALADHTFHRYDLVKSRMAAPDPLDDVVHAVRRALRSGHRVWVVGTLDAAPPGQRPMELPPAPAGPWGWQEAPYVLSWSQQMEAYLRVHSAHQELLRAPFRGPVNGIEHLTVRVFQGWRRPPRRAGRSG